MFKALFDSRNFSFEAYGETEKVAIASLKVGLTNHAKQYDIEPDWWKQYEGDIFTVEIALGSCYRDNGEKIPQY
jgi:hypothetical protein